MWAAPRDDRRPFIALMVALIVLAWLTLWVWGRSPGGLFYSHHGPGTFVRGGAFVLVFVAGWTVMVVAMMLPTSLPLVTLFRAIVRRRRDRALLVALLIAGYLGTWTLFGSLVYLGGWVLQQIARQSGWLAANGWVVGAGILALAGIYQFTPLKYKCLEKCRSPLSFIVEHWRGSGERSQAFRLGTHHGLFCVGCCWSLMLLMFLVGTGSLVWMLALGAVMAVEKNMPWGRRISAPLGATLVGCGLILGITPALQTPDGAAARVALTPRDHSGVSGTAAFADTSGGIEVKLDVRGLPEPEATYLAHVHPGSCAGEPTGGDEDHAHGHHHGGADEPAGEIEHPLTPITSDSGGDGSSTTVIKGVTVANLFSDEELHVNVHAEASGSEELSGDLACGDLHELDDKGVSK
jgi:predicted metal-binding membrane protein